MAPPPRGYFPEFMAAAHRGGGLYRPNLGRENTLHAFEQATKLGYRYLETDVRTTRDGKLVVHHDPDLDRTTDGTGRIRELSLSAVRQAKVSGIDCIPTLSEALHYFPNQRFLIDLKDPAGVMPLIACLEAHNAWDRVSVGSFGSARLARFRRAAKGRATTVASPVGVAVQLIFPRGLYAVPAAFQIPVSWMWRSLRLQVLTPRFIANAHARGAGVHVWTINSIAEMHRVLDLGVDGIVTDAIDIARDVLQERGLWEGNDDRHD